MWNCPRLKAASAAALACLLVASGQPLQARAADSRIDPAEAAAAMERAKRQAANPLRVILQASKVRRKVGAEPELTLVSTAAPTPAPVLATALATAAAPMAAPQPATMPVAAAHDDDAPQPAPAEPAALVRTLHASTMAVALLASDAPALQATDRPDAPAAMPATVAPSAGLSASQLPAPLSGSAMPRLIEMIEPALPQRVLDQIGRLLEINVEVTIRPDGSVAAAVVEPPAPRQLVRYVVAAVERWRFAALPAEQVHRVRLVFNEK